MGKMKFIVITILVSASMAQQVNIESQEQGQAYMGNAFESYYPAHAQGYPHEEPAFKPLQNRNGIEARTGFFDISGSYATSLVATYLFVMGFILVIELVLGDLNIIKAFFKIEIFFLSLKQISSDYNRSQRQKSV